MEGILYYINPVVEPMVNIEVYEETHDDASAQLPEMLSTHVVRVRPVRDAG